MTTRGQSPHFLKFKAKFWEWFGRRYGAEYSVIRGPNKMPYMSRWILYIHGCTLRLHKFWQGDDDRAPHDHPWDFWTFPLTSYIERTYVQHWPASAYGAFEVNTVKAFLLHARAAEHRHIVTGRADGKIKPFWTFVFTGPLRNSWGFWQGEKFIPWRLWK